LNERELRYACFTASNFVADARAGCGVEVWSRATALVRGHEAAAGTASCIKCGLVPGAIHRIWALARARLFVKSEFGSWEGAYLRLEQAFAVANIGRCDEAEVLLTFLLGGARATTNLWAFVKFSITIANAHISVFTNASAITEAPLAIAWTIELFERACFHKKRCFALAGFQIPFLFVDASDAG